MNIFDSGLGAVALRERMNIIRAQAMRSKVASQVVRPTTATVKPIDSSPIKRITGIKVKDAHKYRSEPTPNGALRYQSAIDTFAAIEAGNLQAAIAAANRGAYPGETEPDAKSYRAKTIAALQKGDRQEAGKWAQYYLAVAKAKQGKWNPTGSNIFKKAELVARKVNQQVMPKELRKIGTQAARNPVVKAAAIGAAAAFTGGAALAAINGAGLSASLSAGSAALKGALTGAGALKTAGKQVAGELVKKGVSDKLKKDAIKKAQKQAEAQKKTIGQISAPVLVGMEKVFSDPNFRGLAEELKRAGYSDQEILAAWEQSYAFQNAAGNAAADAAYVPIYNQLVNSGVPADYATIVAADQAQKVAAEAVEEVKTPEWMKIAALLIPVAFAAFGG